MTSFLYVLPSIPASGKTYVAKPVEPIMLSSNDLSVALNRIRPFIALGGVNGTIKILDLETQKVVSELSIHEGPVWEVIFLDTFMASTVLLSVGKGIVSTQFNILGEENSQCSFTQSQSDVIYSSYFSLRSIDFDVGSTLSLIVTSENDKLFVVPLNRIIPECGIDTINE